MHIISKTMWLFVHLIITFGGATVGNDYLHEEKKKGPVSLFRL